MRLVVTCAALAAVLAGQTTMAATAPKPNLKVAAVALGAKSVAPGGKLAVSETTINSGAARAGKSVTAYFLSTDARKDARDRRVGSRSVPALKARKRSAKRLSLSIPASQPAGTFRLLACADDKRKLKEKSERDNCRAAAGSLVVAVPQQQQPSGGDVPGPTGGDSGSPPGPGPTDPGPGPGPGPGTPPATSQQLAAAHAAPDGAASLPVEGAVVTYLKPALGSDPAGFFVQADKAGPALFVAVNPISVLMVLAPGDRVSFTIDAMGTVGGLREATAISGFSRTATGVDLSALVQDVSNATDVVTGLDSYESELVGFGATIAGPFTAAGAGHSSAPINTAGLSDPGLRLRVPTTLVDGLDLVNGCELTLDAGPMWRFNAVAQPSAYNASDLTVHSCPAPTVVSAEAASPTSVVVTFDRHIDPATVAADGSQFAGDNGLTFSAAVASGKTVTLTSSTQTSNVAYTVTVASSVHDAIGTSVGMPNSALFNGFVQKAVLRLTEINPGIANQHDLIELEAVSGGTIEGTTIEQVGALTETVVTMPAVTVSTGDLIVVHVFPSGVTGIAPDSETTSKNQFAAAMFSANYDGAWDILGGAIALTNGNRVIRVADSLDAIQDAVPFVASTSGSPSTAFPSRLQELQAAGLWFPADCAGALCTYVSTPTAVEISVDYAGVGTTPTGNSVQRKAGTATMQKSDWNAAGAQTFGAANP